jgi:molybdenum cofactor guanylyltransferase
MAVRSKANNGYARNRWIGRRGTRLQTQDDCCDKTNETHFVFPIIAGIYWPGCYHFGMRRAGFVLVGGRSSRMGRDKALLPWNAEPLAEQVAKTVEQAAGNVALIGAPERYRALQRECLPDLHPGLGPLAGIEAALASGRGDWNLIVACDMPDLDAGWLSELLDTAETGNLACLAARDGAGMVHPLCAVYRNDCLAAVQGAIDRNRLRAQDLLKDLEAASFDFPAMISNVNTPGDWIRWQRVHHVGRY